MKFERLKFYQSGDSTKAVVFFKNGLGAAIWGWSPESLPRGAPLDEDYQLAVLRATKPRSKGIIGDDAIVVTDSSVTDGGDRLYHLSRDEVEDALEEIAALPKTESRNVIVVVAIYGSGSGYWVRDGALYGASTDMRAESPQYWRPLRVEREPHALFWATGVPEDLALRVEAQGTPDQRFADGYLALDAIRPYLEREPFYESPAAWAEERDEEERDEEEQEED